MEAQKKSRDVSGLEAGDVIGVRYEPVHGKNSSTTTMVMTITDEGMGTHATDKDGSIYQIRTDGGDAMELAKVDSYGNPRRNGWVDEVTRIGWE